MGTSTFVCCKKNLNYLEGTLGTLVGKFINTNHRVHGWIRLLSEWDEIHFCKIIIHGIALSIVSTIVVEITDR